MNRRSKKRIDIQSMNSSLFRLQCIHHLQINIIRGIIHEIKSPLGGISGYVDLMEICWSNEKNLSKMGRYKTQIERGLEEVNFFIKQLQDIAHENVITEQNERFRNAEIGEILGDICKEMDNLCRQKNITLKCIKPQESIDLPVDIALLKLVVINLIGNAIKYTAKPGRIVTEVIKEKASVFIRIKSSETVLSTKDIESMFLSEMSDDNQNETQSELNRKPYFFGIDCIKLIHHSVKVSIASKNNFMVIIQLAES